MACLFETCRGYYQDKIQENTSHWFYYIIYHDAGQYHMKCRDEFIHCFTAFCIVLYSMLDLLSIIAEDMYLGGAGLNVVQIIDNHD